MFINGEGLAEYKELEKHGHSKVKDIDEASKKKVIHGVTPDKDGNINLDNGTTINIDELTAKISKQTKWREMHG